MAQSLGPPAFPLADVDLRNISFLHLESHHHILTSLNVFPDVPSPAMLGIEREGGEDKKYTGGEREAEWSSLIGPGQPR